MPRPRNKEELVIAATENYEKLITFIENRTENEKKHAMIFRLLIRRKHIGNVIKIYGMS